MLTTISTETIHNIIRKLVSYGAPHEKDSQGPNKPDWPFFSRVAGLETMEEHEFIEAATRFHKYRNTQLPRILRELELTDLARDVGKTLEQIRIQGEVAKKARDEQAKHRAQVSAATTSLARSYKHGDEDKKLTAIQKLIELGYDDAQLQEAEKSAAEMAARWKQAEIDAKTIKSKKVVDKWTNKWGKTIETERIGLVYNYNPDLNSAIKSAAPFPASKFDGRLKLWTISVDKKTIIAVINAIEKVGWYVDDNLKEQAEVAIDKVTATKEKGGTTVTLEKNTMLVVKTPYLANPQERSALMNLIKGTDGRKWNADRKVWTFSIAQAGDFMARLEKLQDISDGQLIDVLVELRKQVQSIEQVDTYLQERAERVAISGAAALNDDEAIEQMRKDLSIMFPEDYELYPFQYVGVRFAKLSGGRCLIGDDMGVGKTIQAIAYCALTVERWPALIVCPASVKYNWANELNTWLPEANTFVIKNGKSEIPAGQDFVVINYDLMKKQLPNLLKYGFNISIFDESHYLKNKKTQRTEASLKLAETTDSVICLSGTAITNRPSEFFTTLNLLRPAEYPNFHTYGRRYCDGQQVHIGRGRYAWQYTGASNTDELHERTRDFCIRRLKKEVLEELPDKVRTIHTVDPTAADLRAYKECHDSWMAEYAAHESRGSMPAGFVLNMLTDLRHQCGLLKVNSTVAWVKEYREQNPTSPLVIFIHHKDVGQNLFNELKKTYSIAGIMGGTDAQVRQQRVEQFQSGKLDILLCSTLAAKEGITLTAADTVVFVEREWVPGWEEQAEDRVNRIGQESDTVWATYISVKGTIDEKFDRVIEEKRKVVKAVLDGGDLDERAGIVAALIESMIESGELPADFGKKKPKEVGA